MWGQAIRVISKLDPESSAIVDPSHLVSDRVSNASSQDCKSRDLGTLQGLSVTQ